MTYWQNVNEAICGSMGNAPVSRHHREHRNKLFRYRARALHGKPKKQSASGRQDGA